MQSAQKHFQTDSDSPCLRIAVNDEPRDVPLSSSLASLADILKLPITGIAVALNGKVVARSEWPTSNLKPNDSVLIITATQGG